MNRRKKKSGGVSQFTSEHPIVVLVTLLAGIAAIFFPSYTFLTGRSSLFPENIIPTTVLNHDCSVPDIPSLINDTGPIKITGTKEIMMKEDGTKGMGVITEMIDSNSSGSYPADFHLLICKPADHLWQNAMQFPIGGSECKMHLQDTTLTAENEKQFLVTSWCGSGGYLLYKIVGFDNNQNVSVLLEEMDIFQGSVSVENNIVTIYSDGRGWTQIWNGNEFVKKTVGFVPRPDEIIVSYWLESDDLIMADMDIITIHIGETVLLRRKIEADRSDSSVNLDLSGDDIEHIVKWEIREEGFAIHGLKEGEVNITAIIGYMGYNFDDLPKQLITVRVVK